MIVCRPYTLTRPPNRVTFAATSIVVSIIDLFWCILISPALVIIDGPFDLNANTRLEAELIRNINYFRSPGVSAVPGMGTAVPSLLLNRLACRGDARSLPSSASAI